MNLKLASLEYVALKQSMGCASRRKQHYFARLLNKWGMRLPWRE